MSPRCSLRLPCYGTPSACLDTVLTCVARTNRYLQQLVSAQATRNRELEAQLQSSSNGKLFSPSSLSVATANGNAHGVGNGKSEGGETDDMGLMLHSEVQDLSGLIPPSSSYGNGKNGKLGSAMGNGNGNGRLHDVAEEGDEMDVGEDGSIIGGEGEMESMNGMDADADADADSPGSEGVLGGNGKEERGRPATRSLRRGVVGQGGVLVKEESGMETS